MKNKWQKVLAAMLDRPGITALGVWAAVGLAFGLIAGMLAAIAAAVVLYTLALVGVGRVGRGVSLSHGGVPEEAGAVGQEFREDFENFRIGPSLFDLATDPFYSSYFDNVWHNQKQEILRRG